VWEAEKRFRLEFPHVNRGVLMYLAYQTLEFSDVASAQLHAPTDELREAEIAVLDQRSAVRFVSIWFAT
jgi:hypothetical protein